MIAVLAPCLYVRCRPVLIGAISAAPVVGGWLTLLLAPDAALRLCAVVYMCALRHRLGGICLGAAARVPCFLGRAYAWLHRVALSELRSVYHRPPYALLAPH